MLAVVMMFASASAEWNGANTITNTNPCTPDDNYANCGCEHASCSMHTHVSLGRVLKTHHHPQSNLNRFPHKCKYHSHIDTCKCICGSQLNVENHESWYDVASCHAGQSHTSIDDFDFDAGSCANNICSCTNGNAAVNSACTSNGAYLC